jgi:hypothetical protein
MALAGRRVPGVGGRVEKRVSRSSTFESAER